MKKFIDFLKKNCDGFPSVHVLEDDYTNASHRIFIYTKYGAVTIFYFQETEKIICRNKSFQKLIENSYL